KEVSRLVRAAHPGAPFFILGESMGGAVVMVAMAEADAPDADGVILVAPAVWGREVMNPFYRAVLWLTAHIIPAARVKVEGVHMRPSDNLAMLKRLNRDPLVIKRTRVDAVYGLVNLMDAAFAAAPPLAVPTLLLYGAHDQLVPRKATRLMLRRLPTLPRLAVYPSGYHMLLRDLQAATVVDDVAAWIADSGAPLPSGADQDSQAFFER
ncbi:MAG: serine aminopeptidase domain-containing protein, partial [Alphaproteobacteria bacterium]